MVNTSPFLATDARVFLTVALDLVVAGISEPVRFRIETRAKIFPQNERFWYFTKKPHQELFYLTVKDSSIGDDCNGEEVRLHFCCLL